MKLLVCSRRLFVSFFPFVHLHYCRHKEAHDRAKRVFGKSNPDYTGIRRRFLLVNSTCGHRQGTLMMKDPNLNGKEVSILRATKDEKKYIVDIASETGAAQRFKVTPMQLVLADDTPVTVHGDNCTVFVDSYDMDTDSYKIFGMTGVNDDDRFEYFDVSRKDVRVQFVPSQISQLGF
jgi:hypothetical protein